ncbi:unnamed protein product [Candidula unifasciata]|uniref:Uncharacterized protein n=1 Tax=Candidula unifasciata TaxID=100452 RepID=A0A8S4A4J0_9EUPU|nr:unnamed protein product [Candidula unifasciata]
MITMVLTSQNACDILELPVGADINLVITKYRQLALKWHPEKHKYSAESVKKFKQVNLAYKRLTSSEFHQDLNMNDCLQLFHQVLFNTAATNGTKYYPDSSESSDEDDDDDSEDSEEEQLNKKIFPRKESSSSTKKSDNSPKNLTEEEKERKRVEKRRAKKRRQRERKRLEKEQKTNGTSKVNLDKSESSDNQETISRQDTSLDDDTQFDPTSAFFTKVVSKKKKSGLGEDQTRKREKTGDKKSDDEADENIDVKVLRSRQLAVRGNEMAQVGQYKSAIQLFTEAISLDPTDFRFFGNRSYCYDRIEQYEKALRDAEKAITLDKDWPKGYFRKGRALAGLKMYADSEKAFLQVLKLDKNCDDAVNELFHVRTRQLMDMGFSSSQSEAAIKKHGSVQAAMDSLLASVSDSTFSNLHISDEEENNFHLHRPILVPPHLTHAADTKMEYGQVTSVRPLPEKYCAFVNFKTKEGAGRAMHHLQGAEVDGQKLLIKFPDNPISNGAGSSVTIRKNITNGATKQGLQPKQTGPVNGVECHFWRTTGCAFGSDCKNKHYPKSKGIDRKPWQKVQQL